MLIMSGRMTIAQETLRAATLVDAGTIEVIDIMEVDRLYFEAMGKFAIKLELCFRVISKNWSNFSSQPTAFGGS